MYWSSNTHISGLGTFVNYIISNRQEKNNNTKNKSQERIWGMDSSILYLLSLEGLWNFLRYSVAN